MLFLRNRYIYYFILICMPYIKGYDFAITSWQSDKEHFYVILRAQFTYNLFLASKKALSCQVEAVFSWYNIPIINEWPSKPLSILWHIKNKRWRLESNYLSFLCLWVISLQILLTQIKVFLCKLLFDVHKLVVFAIYSLNIQVDWFG